jgi:hypothetical protein
MSPCEAVSDKMALVAHGQAEWTGEEAAHRAGCPACEREWQLVQAARRLGAGAAERVDPVRVSAAVLAELGRARRRRLWGGGLAGLAAAAALAVVFVSGRAPASGTAPGSGTGIAALYLPLAELEPLSETQLEAVLDGLEAPLAEGGAVAPPSLGDLDDVQLERVLRSLEG